MSLIAFARSFKCAWCDARVHRPSPFCSDLCKEKAKHIRYGRKKLEEGTFWNEDIMDALLTKVASVASGGYADKARRVPPANRAKVIDRASGLCERCGQPGSEVHHRFGDSNDSRHLEYLCKSCHDVQHGRGMGLPTSKATEEYILVREEDWQAYCREQLGAIPWGVEFLKLTFRKRPLRRCHDHQVWEEYQRHICMERGRMLRLRGTS